MSNTFSYETHAENVIYTPIGLNSSAEVAQRIHRLGVFSAVRISPVTTTKETQDK